MSDALKVWHVFGTMNIGGAELRTLELADAIGAHRVKFEYVTLSGAAGVLDERIEANGGRVHPIPLSASFPVRFYRSLRRHRPDAVDSHVATFSGLLLLLAWLARVPVRIAHFRSDGDGRANTMRRRMQRAAMIWLIDRCATDIVGVSPSSLTYGFRPDWGNDHRARVIPNGLPPVATQPDSTLRNELALPSEAALIMHVGRPSPEKNRPLAVRVLSALVDAGHDAHLVFVGGTGSDSDAVADVTASVRIGHRVHHLGRRNDVRHLLAQADLSILTSIREGLPGVVLESLSVGTPVISTPLPGVLFIKSAVLGVQTAASDDMTSWIAAFKQTRGDQTVRRREIRDAFAAGPFSLDRSTMAHLDLYRANSNS